MAKEKPEFGLCLKLWTALQSDYFWTLSEKNWHTFQLLNANQQNESNTAINTILFKFSLKPTSTPTVSIKKKYSILNVILPFSSYTILHTTVKYWVVNRAIQNRENFQKNSVWVRYVFGFAYSVDESYWNKIAFPQLANRQSGLAFPLKPLFKKSTFFVMLCRICNFDVFSQVGA